VTGIGGFARSVDVVLDVDVDPADRG